MEMRHVTLDYLNELYDSIARLRGEVEACHRVLQAVYRRQEVPVEDPVFDRLLSDFARVDRMAH